MELGIFVSHIIWRIRTRRIRKEAAAEDKTFDDIAAEHELEGAAPFKFAERKTRRDRKHAVVDEEIGSQPNETVAVPDGATSQVDAVRVGEKPAESSRIEIDK